MGLSFKKATKQAARLRMALVGPAGSGKTFTGLKLAAALGGRIAVIDTEKGSASKYADLFDFDVLELDEFSPLHYVDALEAAAAAGYGVVLVDSLSHAWVGKGGALEMHDDAVAQQRGQKNTYTAWAPVTKAQNAMIDAIMRAPFHVIATMRAKTEYAMAPDERTGKMGVKKIGMAPVQRDGVEFEFDVIGDMNTDNDLVVSKTRCPELTGRVFAKPGKDVAEVLIKWLGTDPVRPGTRQEEAAPVRPDAPKQQNGAGTEYARDHAQLLKWVAQGAAKLTRDGFPVTEAALQARVYSAVEGAGVKGEPQSWGEPQRRIATQALKTAIEEIRSGKAAKPADFVGAEQLAELARLLREAGLLWAKVAAVKALDLPAGCREADLTPEQYERVAAALRREIDGEPEPQPVGAGAEDVPY